MSGEAESKHDDDSSSEEDVLIGRAIELNENGETEAAIRQLEAVLQRSPHSFRARGLLANFISDTGRYEDALRMMQKLERERPDDPYVQANLGVVLRRMERHDEALVHFLKARESEPDHVRFQLEVPESLMDLDRVQEALNEYTRILTRFPESAEAWWKVGNLFLTRFDAHEMGFEYLQRAHDLDPQNSRALSDLSGAAVRFGKLNDAEGYAMKALRLDPHDYIAMCNMGAIEENRGRPKVALMWYERARHVCPTYDRVVSIIARLTSLTPPTP